MNLMLKTIKDKLDELTILTVSYEEAPRGSAYPYIVYNVPNQEQLEIYQRGVLEIDVWYDDKKRKDANTMAETIRTGMDRYFVCTANVGFRLLYRSTLSIPDPDENIVRRQVIFEIRDYHRKLT